MARRLLIVLLLMPAIALGQAATSSPVQLLDGGRELARAGSFGADTNSWILRLPFPSQELHVVAEDLLLVREGSRWRFLLGGVPGSNSEAELRTFPLQLPLARFQGLSADHETLVFGAGNGRESIAIGALRGHHLRSSVAGLDVSPPAISEPLMTPVTRLFWQPSRPAQYVGPGHGARAEVIAAFSFPRPAESIEEYEPADCDYPMHLSQPDRHWTWVPTQVNLYQHSLRDRKGNRQNFFTALESPNVTYVSEREAFVRGCEASYRRTRVNTFESVNPASKPGKGSYRVGVELRDGGVPAEGVVVRVREWRENPKPSCGEQASVKSSDFESTDGLTLKDGSFVWQRDLLQQGWSVGTRHRRGWNFKLDGGATLCIRSNSAWLPIWHSNSVHGSFHIVCDLAKPGAQRCRKTS
jgi:hypothetical protein